MWKETIRLDTRTPLAFRMPPGVAERIRRMKMNSFDQRVMEGIVVATNVTEAPVQADLFRTPNCTCSDVHLRS